MITQANVKINNSKQLIIAIFLILILASMGCSNSDKINEYSIEQFTNDMKSKNYNFELKDTEKDFLPTTRHKIIKANKFLE
ncbi:hypothetical protein [Pseudobacteroides cellulosolvens]|uniref:Uncharacterized protein n=1 Tax=Pseudobacteroides cellulosolvens ATCC 35603 = DSM 2933 TaxID=398512 RepID=A0A0L6JVT8_9FIRM|nr:hypothetical protein [Pseudobacteroides cellulosolvens]KNY29834.1 hypothetical protein Bccel_5111 [Pseudobacteroides cellulosolvens ATCC 35603 = DSM 2933]